MITFWLIFWAVELVAKVETTKSEIAASSEDCPVLLLTPDGARLKRACECDLQTVEDCFGRRWNVLRKSRLLSIKFC